MMRSVTERAIAFAVLLALLPILLLLAVAVRLSSPGPVLFKQVRVGQGGQPFVIYKFRTMIQTGSTGADRVSPAGDPRVTSVGRVLRDWYLDELPQFFNVLKGDMSLVGPRPETPEFVELYSPRERRVLTVRPGLVGPSTLAFMDEASQLAANADPLQHYRQVLVHERVRLDLSYLDNRSWHRDLGLLTRQAVSIVRR